MDSVEVETPEHENAEVLDAVRKAKKEADKHKPPGAKNRRPALTSLPVSSGTNKTAQP